MVLDKLLSYIVKHGSSDLHLSSKNTAFARTNGSLMPISGAPIFSNQDILSMLHSIMSDEQKTKYTKNLELDFSISHKQEDSNKNSRFRVNTFNSMNGPAAVFRVIPSTPMTLKDISAPKIFSDLCKLSKGLVLITGQTGSGKSTTLSAMINNINSLYNQHIITIEDPIEFVFKSDKCLINQREIGSSTLSFPNALKSSLREDPDIIMVGEMRDLETIRLALTAAETGHLVFGTLHTNSAAQSINRIVDVFPPHDKGTARSILSSSLQAVISQKLIKQNGGGRCAAYEIMIANASIRNLIREDKIPQIASIIEIGQRYGMITMKDSIANLVEENKITQEVADEIISSLGA